MKILIQRPPNFGLISETFPVVAYQKGILYCYDHIIYNPDNVEVTSALMDHEIVHSVQQAGAPDEWWAKYCRSQTFRFDQELEAHRWEYHSYGLDHKDRNDRARYLAMCARRLSGPLYGGCVDYNYALKLIKET